jgi:hypothetical protein
MAETRVRPFPIVLNSPPFDFAARVVERDEQAGYMTATEFQIASAIQYQEKYREFRVFEADLGAWISSKPAKSLRFWRELPRDRNRES